MNFGTIGPFGSLMFLACIGLIVGLIVGSVRVVNRFVAAHEHLASGLQDVARALAKADRTGAP